MAAGWGALFEARLNGFHGIDQYKFSLHINYVGGMLTTNLYCDFLICHWLSKIILLVNWGLTL